MQELKQILLRHTKAYPLMHPCDAVKLIYQNEFGGGHLITDKDKSLKRLKEEYASVKHDPSEPLYIPIGNGISRVQLTALDIKAYSLEKLNEDFIISAQQIIGSQDRFISKLQLLHSLAQQGLLRVTADELEQYLIQYAEAGYQIVSHSEEYRCAYQPAYRIVLQK